MGSILPGELYAAGYAAWLPGQCGGEVAGIAQRLTLVDGQGKAIRSRGSIKVEGKAGQSQRFPIKCRCIGNGILLTLKLGEPGQLAGKLL